MKQEKLSPTWRFYETHIFAKFGSLGKKKYDLPLYYDNKIQILPKG